MHSPPSTSVSRTLRPLILRRSSDKRRPLSNSLSLTPPSALKDGDGRISTNELGTILRSLGRTPSDAELQQIVAKIDQNRSGFIEFDEFVRLMASDGLNVAESPVISKSPDEPRDELYQAFKSFDQDGSGKISKSELAALLSSLGERLSPDELQEMIKAADLNGDEEIDFPEFKKVSTPSRLAFDY